MRYVDIPGVKRTVSQMVMGAEDFFIPDETFRHMLLDQWLDRGGGQDGITRPCQCEVFDAPGCRSRSS